MYYFTARKTRWSWKGY